MIFLSSILLVWVIPEWCPPWPGYGMKPTLMPNIAGAFILALSLFGLIRACLTGKRQPQPIQDEPAKTQRKEMPGWAFLVMFILPCACFMPAVSLIGFIPAGIIFMVVIQLLCGQRKAMPFILVCTLPILLFWLIMRYGLGAPLP